MTTSLPKKGKRVEALVKAAKKARTFITCIRAVNQPRTGFYLAALDTLADLDRALKHFATELPPERKRRKSL